MCVALLSCHSAVNPGFWILSLREIRSCKTKSGTGRLVLKADGCAVVAGLCLKLLVPGGSIYCFHLRAGMFLPCALSGDLESSGCYD